MKRVIKTVITAAGAALCALALSACGEHAHSFADTWSYNQSGHWHAATCGHFDAETVYAHEYDDGRCVVCDYKAPHEHSLVRSEPKSPSCTETGRREYWSCAGCDLLFADDGGTQTIRYDDVVIPKTPHEYKDEYSKDDEYHWQDATCGCDLTRNKEAHAFIDGECVVCLYRPGFTDAYYDGVRYTLDEGGQSYSVTGNVLDERLSNIMLRDEIDGKPVKAIAHGAFKGCSALQSVVLPATVESIGDEAFYFCGNLASVSINANVKSVGASAFDGCPDIAFVTYAGDIADWCDIDFDGVGANPLYSSYGSTRRRFIVGGKAVDGALIIPDAVTEIKPYVFAGCGLSSVTLHDGVARVGKYAFWSSGISSLTLGRGLTEIGDEAFRSSALARVDAPDLNSWLRIRFGGGCANPMMNSWNGHGNPFTEIKAEPAIYYGGKVLDGQIVLPEATVVPAYTFKNSGVTGVTVPNGVVQIKEGAFFKCADLADFDLPDSVARVDKCAFYGCGKLAPLAMRGVTSVGDYAFYGCFNNAGTLELGADMQLIGKYAFARTGIKSLALAARVKEIDATAFYQTFYLDGIAVAESNPNYAAYGNCIIDKRDGTLVKGCKSSVIPEGVTAIGDYALSDCELTAVTLPQSVRRIGAYAFEGNDFTKFVVPDGVTEIGERAFDDCRKLVDLTIPDSVTRMPDLGNFYLYNNDAFEYDADGALYVGNHLIDARMAEGEYAVKDGTVTVSGSRVFYGVTGVVLPDSVKYVAPNVFHQLENLTSVTLGGGVTRLDTQMFFACHALTEVRLSGNIVELGGNVFDYCDILVDVYFDGTLAEWHEVKKHELWSSHAGEFTVHCADGDIAYNG